MKLHCARVETLTKAATVYRSTADDLELWLLTTIMISAGDTVTVFDLEVPDESNLAYIHRAVNAAEIPPESFTYTAPRTV